MPLHDWNVIPYWADVHTFWTVRLAQFLRPLLPEGYRTHITRLPSLVIGVDGTHPDLSVVGPYPPLPMPYQPEERANDGEADPDPFAPDVSVDVLTLETPDLCLVVEYRGMMTAAIELVSPRNKDRPESRADYGAKYVSYLRQGVNLMLVDVFEIPRLVSFADQIEDRLEVSPRIPRPAPFVASYRVDARLRNKAPRVNIWHRALKVGQVLPKLPFAINSQKTVLVDLEATYSLAANDAYLA